MKEAKGVKLQGGAVLGKLHYFCPPETEVTARISDDEEGEWKKFEDARHALLQQKESFLAEQKENPNGADNASVVEGHVQILQDEELLKQIRVMIREGRYTASYAVQRIYETAAHRIETLDDPLFQARSEDVRDVGNSLVAMIQGRQERSVQGTEPAILVLDDLSSSLVLSLDRTLLLGMVVKKGSLYSHASILARALNLPVIIQCSDVSKDWDGKYAALDADEANVILDPNDRCIASIQEKKRKHNEGKQLLEVLKGKPNRTHSGQTISIMANIGDLADLDAVKANDADGVGLFRTEFVYLNSRQEPGEEEQFNIYRYAATKLSPKPIVFRTCDIGADKTTDYMKLGKEENPAMGFRAIRICLERKDFFKRHLRAILRASAYGNVKILLPMITSMQELREAKAIFEECCRELKQEGKPMADYIPLGAMIETPAAAFLADELAQEVDFLSVGTNDLLQFTCAIDRQNAKLEPFYDPHHPAVLEQIEMSVKAAHRHNIPAGICGELGADRDLTELFLRLGVDELSVNPLDILPLRQKVRSL